MSAGLFIHLDHQSSHYQTNLRPGDHVLWKTEEQTRTAVVQVVHPSQRVAALILTDGSEPTPETHMASLLELDPHGTYDIITSDPTTSPEELGVHRGEFVFIHREGTTNGSVMPRVPKIGELESWIQDVPSLYSMQAGGFTDVMYAEGLKLITAEGNWRDGRPTPAPAGALVRPVLWFGYVSDVGLLWFRTSILQITEAGTYNHPSLALRRWTDRGHSPARRESFGTSATFDQALRRTGPVGRHVRGRVLGRGEFNGRYSSRGGRMVGWS